MRIMLTTDHIMWFCSLVAALWGVWKIVKEIKKPSDDLRDEVARHAKILDNDNKRLKEMEDSNKMILQCLLVLLNHEITGNGVDKMKAERDKLQDFLITK